MSDDQSVPEVEETTPEVTPIDNEGNEIVPVDIQELVDIVPDVNDDDWPVPDPLDDPDNEIGNEPSPLEGGEE